MAGTHYTERKDVRIITMLLCAGLWCALPALADNQDNCGREANARGLKGESRMHFMKRCVHEEKAARKDKHRHRGKHHDDDERVLSVEEHERAMRAEEAREAERRARDAEQRAKEAEAKAAEAERRAKEAEAKTKAPQQQSASSSTSSTSKFRLRPGTPQGNQNIGQQRN